MCETIAGKSEFGETRVTSRVPASSSATTPVSSVPLPSANSEAPSIGSRWYERLEASSLLRTRSHDFLNVVGVIFSPLLNSSSQMNVHTVESSFTDHFEAPWGNHVSFASDAVRSASKISSPT